MVNTPSSDATGAEVKCLHTEGRATEAPVPAQKSWLCHSTFPCKWHSCPWQEPCLVPSSLVTVGPHRQCHAQITEKPFSEFLWAKTFPKGKRRHTATALCHVSPVLQSSSTTGSPCSSSVPYSAPTEATFRAILQSWTKTFFSQCLMETFHDQEVQQKSKNLSFRNTKVTQTVHSSLNFVLCVCQLHFNGYFC